MILCGLNERLSVCLFVCCVCVTEQHGREMKRLAYEISYMLVNDLIPYAKAPKAIALYRNLYDSPYSDNCE